MKCSFWFLIIACFFLKIPIQAQQTVDFIHKNLTIEHGLPESTVFAIVEDEIGFIWMATPNFLCRYDGSDFKVIQKSFDFNPDPEKFKSGKLYVYDNKLWMITKGGKLEIMDLQTENIFQIVKFGNTDTEIPELRCLLFDGSNRIYFGTEKEGLFITDKDFNLISHYHKGSFQKLSSNRINHLISEHDEQLLILTDNGINTLKSGLVKQTALGKNFQTGVQQTDSRRTFLGTLGDGLWVKPDTYMLDLIFNNLIEESSTVAPKKLNILSLLENKKFWEENYTFWMATLREGLMVRVSPDKLIRQVNLPDKPTDILSLLKTNLGYIWIATKENGIYVIDEKVSFNFFVPKFQYDYRYLLQFTSQNEGFSYATSTGQIFNYNPDFNLIHFSDILKRFGSGDLNQKYRYYSIPTTGEIILVDESDEVLLFDPVTDKFEKINTDPLNGKLDISSDLIFFKSSKTANHLFMGSAEGLFVLDIKKNKFSKISDSAVSKVVELGNTDFVVVYEKGFVEVFNIRNNTLHCINTFLDVLPEKLEINSSKFQNDWLWIATLGQGIYCINLKFGDKIHFNQENGLPNNFIMAMQFHDTRTVWCSTNNGVFKMHYGLKEGKLLIQDLQYFNFKNGLPVNEFKPDISFMLSKEKLCFGGSRELLCFDVQDVLWQEKPAQLLITQVKANNSSIETEVPVHLMDDLYLDHNQNSLEFHFSTIGNPASENHQYSYFLEGYDKSWVSSKNMSHASYTNLEPGKYAFHVKLTNENFSGAPLKIMNVHIRPAFYQTIWFKVSMVFLVILLLYTFYRFRLNQILSLQKVKEEISADLHDDLGARLTTIQLMSAINKNKFKNQLEVRRVLEKIEKEVNESSEALHDLVSNIKMNESHAEEFLSKLRRYSSEILDQANITYKINFEIEIANIELRMQKRREILLIVKEILNNIRKHSQATFVEIKFSKIDNSLYLMVKDNGIGFEPNRFTNRNGLINIKSRVDNNHGKCLITAKPKLGVKIEIWIPFNGPIFIEKFLGTNSMLRNRLISIFSKYEMFG